MPTVFLREGNLTFHRHEECRQLKKKPAKGEPHPVISVELRTLVKARPCKTCYTDAPRAKLARRHCTECKYKRTMPCRHNGGVPVRVPVKINYVSLLRDPGDEIYRTVWVWPDRAHLYEIAS